MMNHPPNLPPVGQWPYEKVFLHQVKEEHHPAETSIETSTCKIGVPFDIESELFKGRMLFRLRNLESSDDRVSDLEYFKGRKRLFQIVIQGRFKKELNVGDVIFGAEYKKPLLMKPPKVMMGPIQGLIKKVCPGVEIDLLSDQPKILSNFAGGVQVIRVDEPGLQPDMTANSIEEETSGLGGIFAAKTQSQAERKKIFSKPKRAKDFVFDTNSVYTFDHYDNIMDLTTFRIKLASFFHYDLDKVAAEPFQCFAKTSRGDYLWNFELWHEKLLQNLVEPTN